MPRNGAGVYSLPAGNPVNPFTIIATAWCNPTLTDIGTELTNSLDRGGRGSMTAALKLFAGTQAVPGLGFDLEPALGFYREAASTLTFVAANTKMMTVKLGAAPILDFPTNGTLVQANFHSGGANQAYFQTHGVNAGTVLGVLPNGTSNTARHTAFSTSDPANAHFLYLGTEATEAIINSGKFGTGTTRPISFQIDSVTKAQLSLLGEFQTGDGAVGTPAWSFLSDPNSGVYSSGPDEVAFATGGVFRGKWTAAGQLNIGTGANFIQLDPAIASLSVTTAGLSALLQTAQLQLNSNKVLGPRDTGWTAMAGAADKATAYNTATITLAQLAGRVMAMQAAFTTHGLIGA